MNARSALFVLAVVFGASPAFAHPGVGIVIDKQGNVYYTDLAQVWRVAPDGTKSIAVPNVHTHELYLDAVGNLYGEHLRYEGEATNRWWHSFWRRSPDGRVERIVAEHQPFHNEDTSSFVRDAAGNSYWADRDHNTIIKNGSVLARGSFHDVRWMTVTPDGVVYFIDALDLIRVTPGGVISTVARNLSSSRFIRADIGAHHYLMGLWTRGVDVYVADFAHGKVKRVSPNGRVAVIAESSLPWSVTGGAFAPNGDLWLLEYSVTSAARVRKVK